MDVFLHVGMGKNGSTAIQQALKGSGDALAAREARYLGMRPLAPGEEAKAVAGGAYMNADAATWTARADAVLATPARSIVISNESFTGGIPKMRPFVDRLMAEATLHVICYVRDPRKWLSSAHVQWGVKHKTQGGRLPRFVQSARRLVNIYDGPVRWKEVVGDRLDIVSYDAVGDVVADLAQRTGLPIAIPPGPVYARPGDAETVMRGLYNDRFDGEMLPQPFDRDIASHLREDGPVPVADMVRRTLDHSQVEQVLEEKRELFERFEAALGMDLLALSGPSEPAPLEMGRMRSEVIDYLAEVVLSQARRLSALEDEVAELRGRTR